MVHPRPSLKNDPGDTRKPENKRYLLPARGGNRIPWSHTRALPRAAARPIPATVALRRPPEPPQAATSQGEATATERSRGRSRVWNGSPSSVSWAAGSRRAPPTSSACHPTDAADATWVQFLCTSVLQYKLHPYCSLFVSLLVVMLYRAQPTRV
jgi:hypothetical protein